MGLKEKTVSSIKWNTISTVVTMLLQIIQLAILTYLLEKSDFGLVAIASLVISFTDIFSELGITIALIHKQDITDDEYSSIYWLNIFVSMAICILTVVVAPFVADFYNEPILKTIVSLFSLKIMFNAFGKMFHTIKVKNLEFGFISKVRIVTAIIGLIITVGLAYIGYGVMSLVYGQLISVGVNQLIFALTGLKHQRISFHFAFKEVKGFLNIGLYQLGTQILDFAAARLDIFLIGKLFSMEDLGVYNIAKDLIIRPFSIINTISTSVFSASFAKIQDNMNVLVLNFNKLIKATTLLATPIYALLFIFADRLVKILYAPTFAEVSVYLRIMACVGLFSAITSQAGSLIIAKGRTDLGLRWTIVRILLSIVFLLTTFSFGLYAVSCGQSVLALVSVFVYYFIVIRPIINESLSLYCHQFLGIILITIVMMLPVLMINHIARGLVIVQIISALLFVAAYIVYIYRNHREMYNEITSYIISRREI